MALFNTWKKVMFNPIEFFEKLPQKVGIKETSIFYLKISAIGIIASIIVGYLFNAVFTSVGLFAFLGLPEPTSWDFFMDLLLSPITWVAQWGALFVGAGIIHLFVMLFKGEGTYKETFIASGYAYAPLILNFIPMIGFLGGVYSLILTVIGIKKLQNLSTAKSVLVVLIPTVLTISFFVILFLFIISVVVASGMSGNLAGFASFLN